MLKTPHEAQLKVLSSQKRRIICVASRRLGKTTLATLAALRCCLDFDRWVRWRGFPGYRIDPMSPAKVMLLAPTRDHVKSLYWEPILAYLTTDPIASQLVKKINATELTIDFYGNRPSLVLRFANHEDGARIRGLKLAMAVTDESQLIDYASIDESLAPALSDLPFSQYLAIGTPAGQGSNSLWRLKLLADKFPEHYDFFHYTCYDNPLLDYDYINMEKETKTPSTFRREYLADFLNFEGQIFETLDDAAKIYTLPDGRAYSKWIAIDWGSKNQAALVLSAHAGKLIVLDGFQNLTGETMSTMVFESHIKRLIETWEVKGGAADPSQPSAIEDFKGKGLPGLMPAYNRIADGIAQVNDYITRGTLKILCGQKKLNTCHLTGDEIYDFLKAYHYEQDKEVPADGVESHVSDCLRYGVAHQNPRSMQYTLAKSNGLIYYKDKRRDPNSKYFDAEVAWRLYGTAPNVDTTHLHRWKTTPYQTLKSAQALF